MHHQKRRRPQSDSEKAPAQFFAPTATKKDTFLATQKTKPKPRRELSHQQLTSLHEQLTRSDEHGNDLRAKALELGRRELAGGMRNLNTTIDLVKTLLDCSNENFQLLAALHETRLPDTIGEAGNGRIYASSAERWAAYLTTLYYHLPELPTVTTGTIIHRSFQAKREEEEPNVVDRLRTNLRNLFRRNRN